LKVAVDFGGLRGMRWQQYAVRFALGGLVTMATGLIAQQFGPVVGGLFLAFPAIFPASATLIAKREQQKKARKGLHGTIRGRRAAALDAAGAALGAIGLMCFAALAWIGLPRVSAIASLGVATAGWLAISLLLWWLHKTHPWRR
jgi:uncharacterized protein DUF3147